MLLARAIRAVVGVVVAIIVLAVVLTLLGANQSNTIVGAIHDAGAWLVGPFANVFSVRGPKLHMALNWGLAAVVYAVVGGLLASFVARGSAAASRRRGLRRPRPVT
jgi:CDP-diglyceride synthetase